MKPIIYLITKKHEIERIISSKSDTGYSKYLSLVNYINRSKALSELGMFINQTKPKTKEEIDDLVSKISNAKSLTIPSSQILKDLLTKGNKIFEAKFELITQSDEQIKLTNDRHKEMLLDIWNHLCPNKPINLIDKQWCSDPLTDFRGSGLLGLKQLHHFVVAEERMKHVYQVATNEKTWYFFAATGINISGNLIQFINQGNCDELFFENTIDLLSFSHTLYTELYCGFNDLWVEKNCQDFMKVNSTIEKFMKERAYEIYHNISKEYNYKKSNIY